MSFAATTSGRKLRRKKPLKIGARQSRRACFFESLEERLNLSLMFLEIEPNQGSSFATDLTAAQVVTHPGSTGIVDSATSTSALDNNADYYTFNATVAGSINVAVINRGGDPGGGTDPGNLDVRVFRQNPVNIDDTIGPAAGLANTLLVGQTYTGSFSAAAGEKFFVRVSGDAGDDDSNYDLRIWNAEASDSSGSNNNSQGAAPNLGTVTAAAALNTAGTITQPDRDYYKFTSGAAGQVSVKITMPDGTGFPFGPGGNQPTNLGIRVRDMNGVIIATSNGTAGNVDIASFNAANSAMYFAEVYSGSFGQINSYVLDISMVGAPEGRVTGFVFQDLNQNTFRDPTEIALPSVTVNIDINNDGGVDRTALTDGNGYYTVGNLPFGTHRISLAPQSGVHAVYPEAISPFFSSYTITISANDLNADHIDFATVRADFGDAPDSYRTLLISNGPRHTDRGPTLGATRDAESDGYNSLGTGDDTTNTGSPDDEDGVTLPATIYQGATANISVQASAAGFLTGWIDFNRNGSFADPGERIYSDVSVVAGANNLPIIGSLTLSTGASYARFRISTQAGLSFDGPAPDGEVEDYPVNLQQNRITIDDVTMTEGDSGIKNFVFTVSLEVASTGTIKVDYVTQDTGSAAAGVDFTAVGPATLTFNPGQTTQTLTVPVIGDMTVEPDETFLVNLSAIMGPAIGGDLVGQGTIINDDSTSLSITDVSLNEGNSGPTPFVFTVSLSKPASTTIMVDYATSNGTATLANNDYTQVPTTTLTFNPGETSKMVTVNVIGDTVVEPDETFNVDLTNNVGVATISDAQGVGTILNDDSPMFSISDFSALEGDSGSQTYSFDVTLSAAAPAEVRVDYKTTDATATTADLDYVGVPLTTLIFPIGLTSITVTVQVNGDTQDEPDETFTVDLSNVVGPATILDGQGIGAILNDDSTRISISDVTQNEGDSGDTDFIFTVSLSNASVIPVTVDYMTMDGTALVSNNDYTAVPTTQLTFTPGQTSKMVTVKVKGDTAVEADETFTVELSNASGASILDGTGLGTILNDDSTVISVADVNRLEGDSGLTGFVFTIVLSRPSTTSVFVDYHTVDGTATLADLDYNQLITTTHEFLPGETMYDVTVDVRGDTKVEANETFRLILSNPMGDATIADNDAVGTILNDDGTGFSISDASVLETDSGTVMMSFDITLSNASTGTHTVTYQTSNGTATTADNDYVAAGPTVVTFNPGVTSQTIMITVNGDTNIEPDETFDVNLSLPTGGATIVDGLGVGTILTDDLPTLSIDDVSVVEGDSGPSFLTFTVTRSAPDAGTATVVYTTSNGTATLADNDYVAATNTLTFAPGVLTQQFTVQVNGDTTVEANETVNVTLSSPTKATILVGSGVGTILNDDSPVLSINDVTLAEGNIGTTTFAFTVSLDRPSNDIVTVTYATSNGTATLANNDYQQILPTVLTFNAGVTSLPVNVLVNGDAFVEGDETFNVNLTLPTGGATIGDPLGIGTITNDDIVEITGTKVDNSIIPKPLAGVTFELYNDDGAFPGVFNPASPFDTNPTGVDTLRQIAVTGADGRYNFGASLPAGTYYIREIPSAGWYQIAPAPPNDFITVTYDGITPVDVDADSAANPLGPFVNDRCSDNRYETSADLGQTITATRAGILTIEVIGNAGVSFVVKSSSGAVSGLNASLVKVPEPGSGFASRGSGNRARVDLVLTQADITAGTTFSLSMVNNAGTSPTLLVTNSVSVDGAKVLMVQGSACGDSIFVRDDPTAGGANSDAKYIFVGSYSGSLSAFDAGSSLVGQFSGVTYNAAIINASFDTPIIASVKIFGGDGNDIIRIARAINQDSVIDAGNGDDIVRSGAGRSTVYGGNGNDFIVGGLENDVIYGGAGNDYIHGRGGGDRIFGGDGNDVISGGEGDDPLIRGENGDDRLSGGLGRDRLVGDGGSDIGYREVTGTGASVDLLVSVDTTVSLTTPTSGSSIPGDLVEDELLALIDRFWADGNPDGPDTLDEIIAALLP